MNQKAMLIAPLVLVTFFCLGADDYDSDIDNENRRSQEDGARVALEDLDDVDKGDGESSADRMIRSIEVTFEDRDVFFLAQQLRTESDLDALGQDAQEALLVEYPDFRLFLQKNDAVGQQLSVKHEVFHLKIKRAFVVLSHAVAERNLPGELQEMPYVTCTPHRRKKIPPQREVLRIVAAAKLKRERREAAERSSLVRARNRLREALR